MTPELREFLAWYLPQGANLDPLAEQFTPRRIKKNSYYISPGKISDTIAFIQTGCFRVFFYDLKGKEITTWFSFDGMVITDMLAFYTGERATFYAQALQDSLVFVIKRLQLEELFIKYPECQQFGRKFAEEALIMLMQRTLSLHTKSAEERYLELMKQPDFLQKIPLKYLASYLGITDTSLSRLRKKIR